MTYVPDRGDVVWLLFNPQTGYEDASRRPTLILSPKSYNSKTGLALCCPITSQIKGYPFEVVIPERTELRGVILADQVKSFDWKSRGADHITSIDDPTIQEVILKIFTLIYIDSD